MTQGKAKAPRAIARGSPDAGSAGSLETQRAAIAAECKRRGLRLLHVQEDTRGGGKGDGSRSSRVLSRAVRSGVPARCVGYS
jgi:hypothetical protein